MRRSKCFAYPAAAVAALALLPAVAAGSQKKPYLQRLAIAHEKRNMLRLHAVKQDAQIRAFTTDGCSGGMSSGWKYLARRIPLFARHLRDRPPWLDCCTRHDMAYWQGETENGFDKRLRADRELRYCVTRLGNRLAPRLSRKYAIPEKKVRNYFRITARLMFHAVRAGGGPCTPFSWRWGYGWPKCR